MFTFTTSRRLLVTAVAVGALALSACSGSTSSESSEAGASAAPPASESAPSAPSASAAASDSLKSLLPAEIQERGYILNLVQSPNAPMEYSETNGGPVIGVDIDIANALGEALGTEIRYEFITDFTQLIPSIQTERADMVLSAVTDKISRQDVVNFVDYFQTGSVFMGLTENEDIREFTDLCGKTIVAATGTTYPDQAAAISKEKCEDAGLPPIEIITASSAADQLLQVRTGRAVANLVGLEPLAYQMKVEPGQWTAVGEPFSRAVYGIMYSKNDDQLGEALRAALQQIIDDGTYAAILEKWNLSDAAVDSAVINGGLTP